MNLGPRIFVIRILAVITLLGGLLQLSNQPASANTQIDIYGPTGSSQFGKSVTELPNGNFIVIDSAYNSASATAVGAVYLYDGASGAMISMLTGTLANDQVGSGGVTVLSNGNYVVSSPNWSNGAATNAGAVTWGSEISGVSGVISAANSLVGSTADDWVGCLHGNSSVCNDIGVIVLSNGNYVVRSPTWDNDTATDAGAVTWGSGTSGVSGAVSALNSLVGSSANDWVGYDYDDGVTVLSNSNYVVSSPYWDNGTATDAGAVTWGSSTTGVSGVISAGNSLVGSTARDQVGYSDWNVSGGVTALANGSYVVSSPFWDNGTATDAGAATWGNGASGITGTISVTNSLIGNFWEEVSRGGVMALTNGNYVVSTPYWDNGSAVEAGAVTWGNGASGITGTISVTNSLVGSADYDQVGCRNGTVSFCQGGGVTVLSNGSYVVSSYLWDNGAVTNAGSVTWGSGESGISGIVSITNSLVGSAANDMVGCKSGYDMGCYDDSVVVLSNGSYVVSSPFWDNGAVTNVGAVTWGNGESGVTGIVSVANSLVGSMADDNVGCNSKFSYCGGVTELANSSYVVSSLTWDNGAATDAGAVTWGSGTGGVKGIVSSANSLVGSTANDQVGFIVTALTNGSYVVRSPYWDNGAATDAGAVTWGSGTGGVKGVISSANSLVGSTTNDLVGSYINWDGFTGVTALANGSYVVSIPTWDNGAATDAGAVTWGSGNGGVEGAVSAANSLVGSTSNDMVGCMNRAGSDCLEDGVIVLRNGSYVVNSPFWSNGAIANAGAVTWGNGASGVSGAVLATNSLVGSTANDMVGCKTAGYAGDMMICFDGGVTALSNGNYVVNSLYWDNGAMTDAGAVTWSFEEGGTSGPITADNSVQGTITDGGNAMVFEYDAVNDQLVVGRSAENIVTLFNKKNPPSSFLKNNPANGASGISTSPTLSWDTSTEATSYEYCYDTTDDNACTSTWINNGTATSVGLSGLNANTTYFWQVKAVNADGSTYADDGTWWSFTTGSSAGSFAKSSPTDEATGISTSPTLSWDTSEGATSYEYCYDTTDDDACASAWINNGTATSMDLSGLSLSTTYYWQVRAVNAGGSTNADNGTWWSFSTGSSIGSFAKSSPADGATGISTSPMLSWDMSEVATSYEYCYDTTNDNTCAYFWINNSAATSADLSGLKGGTTYYWQVRAVNGEAPIYANNGTWWSFTTAPYINYLSLAIK